MEDNKKYSIHPEFTYEHLERVCNRIYNQPDVEKLIIYPDNISWTDIINHIKNEDQQKKI